MKREILCKACALHFMQTETEKNYPGEYVRKKWGRILYHNTARCDMCNVELGENDVCCCLTIHTGNYYSWEKEYIYPIKKSEIND